MTPIIDLERLRQGERRSLAKAITLVESKRDEHRLQAQKILEAILPDTGNSIRIGISGSPGVGKSTFIEAFDRHLIAQGKKVAVLAKARSSLKASLISITRLPYSPFVIATGHRIVLPSVIDRKVVTIGNPGNHRR